METTTILGLYRGYIWNEAATVAFRFHVLIQERFAELAALGAAAFKESVCHLHGPSKMFL